MLFSEIGSAYYERLGFRVVPHSTSDITVKTKDGAPAVLVRAGEDRDAASVAETHARRVERYRFGLVPDADQVNYSVAKKRMLAGFDSTGRRTLEYFVTEEGYQAVAYVLLQVTRPLQPGEPEAWSLAACGDRDPEGARIGAMLQVLLARHPGERPPAIRAWWPDRLRPPQLEIARRGPGRRDLHDSTVARRPAHRALAGRGRHDLTGMATRSDEPPRTIAKARPASARGYGGPPKQCEGGRHDGAKGSRTECRLNSEPLFGIGAVLVGDLHVAPGDRVGPAC